VPRLLVIGLGRRDRGDDVAGLLVAERLTRLTPLGIHVALHQGETTALIDLWFGLEIVILIDATDLGASPGTLSRYEDSSTPIPTRHLSPAPHDSRTATAFELARVLGRLPSQLVVLGVEGASFSPGSSASETLLHALPATVERLATEIIALEAAFPGKLLE
jgi:hydrogenase maturation protease